MENKIQEFTIKRSEWLHGEGNVCSYLLRKDDGKRCCLGFYLSACGVSDTDIEDIQAPSKVIYPPVPSWLLDSENIYSNSEECQNLMVINDNTVMPLHQREGRIKGLFAKQGIKVNFID